MNFLQVLDPGVFGASEGESIRPLRTINRPKLLKTKIGIDTSEDSNGTLFNEKAVHVPRKQPLI